MSTEHKAANAEHAMDMSAVIAASWKQGYKDLVSDPFLDSIAPDRWKSFLEVGFSDGRLHGILQRTDGQHSGAAVLRASHIEGFSGDGEILCFYMAPDHMRRGLGSVLLAWSEERLRELGFTFSVLAVLQGNAAAKSFYIKNGYAQTGFTIPAELDGRQMLCDILRKRIK